MNLEVDPHFPRTIRIAGEIDVLNTTRLRAELDEAVSESPAGFVLDLRDLTYIDSLGIAEIMNAYQRICPSGGKIALVIDTDAVKSMLGSARLESLPGICVCSDPASAKQAMTK